MVSQEGKNVFCNHLEECRMKLKKKIAILYNHSSARCSGSGNDFALFTDKGSFKNVITMGKVDLKLNRTCNK
jgi:hypothetical protein